MRNNDNILFWKKQLCLTEWIISSESIDKEQVLYDKSIPKEDRYFVGVYIDIENKIATIYHDRKLTDEYILHELLHVKFPKFTEKQVNDRCADILSGFETRL